MASWLQSRLGVNPCSKRYSETVVTCTYTYAFQLMSAPRALGNANYLELLFLNGFDWNKVSSQLNSMWTGQYGPWLASVF